MRGRKSGHHRALPSVASQSGHGADKHGQSVVTDIDESFPVTAAELDALEAFLMPQLLALLAQDAPENRAHDSEVPQRRAQSKDHSVHAERS